MCKFLVFFITGLITRAQEIYEMPAGVQSRLRSFGHPTGVKYAMYKTIKTARDNAFEILGPHSFRLVAEYSTVSYFYQDKPSGKMSPLATVVARTGKL